MHVCRASLRLNGVHAPLSILSDVTLVVTTTDSNNVPSSHTVTNFLLKEFPQAAVHSINVPEGSRRVSVSLSANVTCMARGDNSTERKQPLSAEASVEVSTDEGHNEIAHAHLTAVGDHFVIQARPLHCITFSPSLPHSLPPFPRFCFSSPLYSILAESSCFLHTQA
jgi:hypothetical protein